MALRRLPAKLHLLSVRQVQTAAQGDHSDGGGLILRVRPDAGASWVFRYTAATSKRREMGLGVAHRANATQAGASLTDARELAQRGRTLLQQGLDPIDERDRARGASRQQAAEAKAAKKSAALTLARAARDYHERVIEPSRSDKHGAQWIASLENHVPSEVWNRPIAEIDAPMLLAALLGVRALDDKKVKVPETLQRIRQRLEAIFEDAVFHKHCTSNPAAALRRKMREAQGTRERGNFKSLPYRDAPAFMAQLRHAEGIAAKCLEFTLLTAARTSEALTAEWSEFDLANATWTIPASKMKAKEQHVVFLSPRAVEVVKGQHGLDDTFLFPSPIHQGKDTVVPMSNMAMLVTLGRMGMRDRTTVHGLRSTFSTWANETGAGRPDAIEACLAHEESNKVRAAYNRAQFMAERRALLEAWADYLTRPAAEVVSLRAA
jgi:integrase